MIRVSQHHFNDLTNFKREQYLSFLEIYRQEAKFCLLYLWNHRISWSDKYGEHILDIQNDLLDCPKMLSTVGIRPPNSRLYARAWACIMTQCLGIINAIVSTRHRLQLKRNYLIQNNESTEYIDKLLSKTKLTFPDVKQLNPELNSICADFMDSEKLGCSFDGFLQLKCLGEDFGRDDSELALEDRRKIRIPIKYHRGCNRLIKTGYQPMTSFLLCDDHVEIRWEMKSPKKKTRGAVVGADQGRRHAITLSDGQQISKNSHGYTLNDIVEAMGRAQSGSKGFQRLQEHQKNFIGWAINQLDLTNIREIHLEELKYLGKVSFHWFYPLIKQRLHERAEEESVILTLQSSSYRSQRCNQCGYVHCKNRKEEEFGCGACGHREQADLNAAKNHITKLSKCERKLLEMQGLSSKEGFYWQEIGTYSKIKWEQLLSEDSKRIENSNVTVPATKKR